MSRLQCFLSGVVIGVLAVAVPAGAATFTVNSTDDAVDANPGDGSCATAQGVCTLRAAIQEANALAGADTIILPAGVYTLQIGGPREDDGATGDLDIRDHLTIVGADARLTIIDGNQLDRVLHVVNASVVHISDVTIQNGRSDGPAANASGGGILNMGTLTLTRVTVRANSTAGFGGGGIANGRELTLNGVTVSDNFSAGIAGGILNGLNVFDTGTLTATNTTISGNAANDDTGGIQNHIFSVANLNNVTITNNMSDADNESGGAIGGILNFPGDFGGTVNLRNTIIAGNKLGISALPFFPFPDCFGTLTSQGHNLIHDVSGCEIVGDTTGNVTGLDPNLDVLKDNGGPTLTHALLPGSPAIDAGDNATCDAEDQRGLGRPFDGDGNGTAICDIGAFELVRFLRVSIDIKPGSHPNSINLGSAGVIPVAILGSATFDATQVNPATVRLAGASVKLIGHGDKYSCSTEDVNGDGFVDLVCHVVTAQFIEPGDSLAVLEAQTFDGQAIRGEDSIRIVP